MKVRSTVTGTGPSTRLAAVGCGIVTLLASLAIAACSGTPSSGALPTPSSSSSTGTSATGSSSPSNSPSTSQSPSSSPSSSPSPSPTTKPSPSTTPSPSPSARPSPTASRAPTAAPSTGGGGTAGFQHASLLVIGIAAVLAGAASLAYRRKVLRNR